MKCELCDKSATWACSGYKRNDDEHSFPHYHTIYYFRCKEHYYIACDNMIIEEYIASKVFES